MSWLAFVLIFVPLTLLIVGALWGTPRREELWSHWIGQPMRKGPGKVDRGIDEAYAHKQEPPITLGPRPLHPRTSRHAMERDWRCRLGLHAWQVTEQGLLGAPNRRECARCGLVDWPE